MIKEAYCSFEVAKLLKEKGFDEPCRSYFIDNVDYIDSSYSIKELIDLELGVWEMLRPTHQMALAWLREKHNILISLIPKEVKVGVDKLCYAIYRITEDVYTLLYTGYINNLVDSYEKAVEAALKYSLENLI